MLQINNLSKRIEASNFLLYDAVKRVMDSGWLVMGPEVKNFEQSFGNYIGVNHCISVANGTDALELALRGVGVKIGDQVATVANAGMYTTTALLAIGAVPVFMDVDLETRNATVAEVERVLELGVQAVVVTHLYGLAVPHVRKIAALCFAKNIPLIEDCAQAHGARVDGGRVGSFGDASCFSFYPTKNLGALGDGGAVVTNNHEIAQRVTQLRQYGWSSKYRVEVSGARNSRLDEIQAAILSVFLPKLDEANERRRKIAGKYSNSIQHSEIIVPEISGDEYVGHLYVIRTSLRDKLREYLKEKRITSDIHYPIPDYKQPIFGNRYIGFRLKNTEKLSQEILTLPCYPEMNDAQVHQVISVVNSWRP
jgi:aminotransferase EvaB